MDRQVFRPSVGRWLGYAWLVFAAANIADLAWRGHSRTAWVIGAVLLLASAIVYITALHPRIVADATGLRIVNPLREISVPWGAVTDVTAADTVRVHTRRPRPYSCWAVQAGSRRRAHGARSRTQTGGRGGDPGVTADDPGAAAGRSRTEYVATELADMAQRGRDNAAAGRTETVTWSGWSLAVLGLGVSLVVAASVIA